MIKVELIVRKFKKKGGKGLPTEWAATIKVKPGKPEKEIGLRDKRRKVSDLPVRVWSDNGEQLRCHNGRGKKEIAFVIKLSNFSDCYNVQGRHVNSGQFAPFCSCTFRSANKSRWRVLLRDLRKRIRV